MEETETSFFDIDYTLMSFTEEERKQIRGKIRLVNEDFAWLKKGEVIKLLSTSVAQIHVESLNTGYSGWLWRQDVAMASNPIEGGI